MRFSTKEIGILFTCIVLDRISKIWALRNLKGGAYPLLPPFFKLKLTFNEGSAFGVKLFDGKLPWIALTAILITSLYLFQTRSQRYKLGRAMITGGALGNLIDRLLNGKVIDFISFYKWPTFNLADTFITGGLILLILSMLKNDDHQS
ncbi:MAG: Lipoprotein signal peptidase [bacterium 42_11]|nr:MAG: Lipoprotein signal peptidase [bacterium 42_11]